MFVVGIHGPLGGGKTYLANLLATQFEHPVILPFAKPLKDFAFQLGWNGQKDAKGRRLLQLLGTECGRECIDEDVWVNHWERARATLPEETDIVIADDMRFDNEWVHIQSLEGCSIKLYGRDSYISSEQSGHASEQPMASQLFDFVFNNQPGTDLSLVIPQITEFLSGLV